ncbi:MAG: hypothetical protein IPO83_13190 [Chitinophagaceae bacterium]|nr:hypothetical protein [Chitinophagaceae bacterium]
MQAEEIFLILIYVFIFSLLIRKLSFFQRFHLPISWIIVIFLIKSLTGILYGLLHLQLYDGGDTISYFNESKILLSALPEHVGQFLRLTLWYTVKPPPPDLASYESQMIYWNVMSSYFMVRMNALMNLVSFNHYFVNVTIYNFLTLTGMLYLFRWLHDYVVREKYILIFVLFLFPSVAFWSSGIHKDGLSIAALGLILFHFQQLLTKITWQRIAVFIFGCWLLLMVRNYLLLLLIPCLAGYALSAKFSQHKALSFIISFLAFYMLLLFGGEFFSTINLLTKMSQQQQEFLHIPYSENISFRLLDGTFISLIKAMPVGIKNCLMLPFLFTINSVYQLPFALDNLLLICLIVTTVFFYDSGKIQSATFIFCMLFSFSIFIFAGSIVPNLGALVRYKMPGILFLIVALISILDIGRIKRLLFHHF